MCPREVTQPDTILEPLPDGSVFAALEQCALRDGVPFVAWSNTLPIVVLAATTCARERWPGSVVGPELPGPAVATTTTGEARAHGWELGRTTASSASGVAIGRRVSKPFWRLLKRLEPKCSGQDIIRLECCLPTRGAFETAFSGALCFVRAWGPRNSYALFVLRVDPQDNPLFTAG